MAGVDLDSFAGLVAAQDDGFPVPIMGPDGITELGLTIIVAGPDSERQRKARQKQINRRLAKRNPGALSAAEIEESNLNLLGETVISWSPDPTFGGVSTPCTPENVVEVLKAFPFIREQLDAAAGSRADFLKH